MTNSNNNRKSISPCEVGVSRSGTGGTRWTRGRRGYIRERVPTSARTNDLCKCSICYPCLLSSFPPPPPFPPTPPASPRRRFHLVDEMAERYKVGVSTREGEKRCEEEARRPREKRGCPKRRRRRGPAFQSPVSTRDPRPLNHPPQLGRNSVLFSPLLCSFLLFSSLRVSLFLFSLFIYLPSLFRPFLPDHGDNRPTLLLLFLLRLLLLRPPMFLRRVLTGENCGKNVVDLRDPLRG